EPCAQCTAMPTKSVCASVRAAVPDGAVCDALPSFHSGELTPKIVVMSPVGSVDVGPYTVAPVACELASGAARLSVRVDATTEAIVACSASAPLSIVICLPVVMPDVLCTVIALAPLAAAALIEVGPPLTITALLFSSTVFAADT